MLLVLLVLVWTVQTTLGQCLTQQDAQHSQNKGGRRELLRSQLDFSLNLFKEVVNRQPMDNIFISPLSIYNSMLLSYFVSNGHTEASLRKALLLPQDQDKLDMLLPYRLQKVLPGSEAHRSLVNTANRLFVSVNQTVKDCMFEFFDNEIEVVDFSAKSLRRTVDKINAWVANQTHNNILNIISSDGLNPGTQLILANAAFFKGEWKNQFDKIDTKPGKFYITKDKAVLTPMMFQNNKFRLWRTDQLEVETLELPYKGSEISLFLLLPDQSNVAHSTANLLKRLDSETLLNIIRELTDDKNEEKIELKLPKFTVERTLELTSILESLGVGDLFQPTSDLTGLTGGPRIQFNSAIHKAKIQVDERGTEAAAATIITDTRIPGSTFICDRPFLYLLYDKASLTLLFAGAYNNPTK